MKSLTERYLEYYTPLIQEFIKNVELRGIPDIKEMPEPFLPLGAESIRLLSCEVR